MSQATNNGGTKGRIFLVNALAPSMFSRFEAATIYMRWVKPWQARAVVDWLVRGGYDIVSAVGHEATARLMSEYLWRRVEVNRINVSMDFNDVLVGITLTERLPEGKVLNYNELMDMALKGKVRFFIATLQHDLYAELVDWVIPRAPMACWRECDDGAPLVVCEDGTRSAIDVSQCW